MATDLVTAGTGEGRQWRVELALVAWIVVALVVGSFLMAGHLIALPAPAAGVENAALEREIAIVRRPTDRGRWLAVHVLYGSCGCSGKVLDHLLERGPHVDTAEQVLLIEDDDVPSDLALIERARARGFLVESLSALELAQRFSIEAAPMLIVMSPDDHLSYVGGYADRKRSPAIRDSEILDRLARGDTTDPLPIYGCAISQRLKRQLDPLGLKN